MTERAPAPGREPGAGTSEGTSEGNPAKRREILDGARRVFRAAGFDGASMDQIARAAGVSKGTLYVYFRNKEDLFLDLVATDKNEAAEQLCRFEADDSVDVETELQRLGERFLAMMGRREHVALVRMVIGAAEKFPQAGRTFYDTGPRFGTRRLAQYLMRQMATRRLYIDDDVELAAAHFFNLCQGTLTRRQLFGFDEEPDPDQIRATVASAVRIFMRAYGPGARRS
ncbi:MAG: TetR/AcrR family transcriptional regulator [Hyphomicrobiales bacterium]|nr:TetR/AcrR family transcriptional regulator [Hyphomicrobiales bacterium]MCP5370117.1 TetR/AcrR family transcriptional regulator [Hyphomicrobiales bacterium]